MQGCDDGDPQVEPFSYASPASIVWAVAPLVPHGQSLLDAGAAMSVAYRRKDGRGESDQPGL
jgi:hypothetical protein